jgi:hypothetical protein
VTAAGDDTTEVVPRNLRVRNPTIPIAAWLVTAFFVVMAPILLADPGRRRPLSAVDIAIVLLLLSLAPLAMFRWAACWVAVTEDSVVIRNPFHRRRLPVSAVKRFSLGTFVLDFRRAYVAVAETSDRRIRCAGLVDGDAEARQRIGLLNERLQHARTRQGLPRTVASDDLVPAPFLPERRAWTRVAAVVLGLGILLYGAWHVFDTSNAAPTVTVAASDRATCTALHAVVERMEAWSSAPAGESTDEQFQRLFGEDPPVQSQMRALATANARTDDPAVRQAVAGLVHRYDTDHSPDGPDSWFADLDTAMAACSDLGL